MKILVVDDNKQCCKLVDYLLSVLGHEVEISNSGTKSLSLLNENQFDAIVLDWNMPGLNGGQTISAYNQLPPVNGKKMNVIIYTSLSFKELEIPDAQNVKINNCISKKLSPHRQLMNFKRTLESVFQNSTTQ